MSDEEYYHKITDSHVVNIGCFGALRLLKNHLQQAMSAIIFADRIGKKLLFHINEDDTEDAENPVYKNLESLFARGKHALITHRWSPHDEFIEVVRQMDLGLQVSLSESYNIVAADFASNGVPIIVSRDIDWMPSWYQADPNVESIVDRLMFAWSNRNHKELTEMSTKRIAEYNSVAISAWFIENRNKSGGEKDCWGTPLRRTRGERSVPQPMKAFLGKFFWGLVSNSDDQVSTERCSGLSLSLPGLSASSRRNWPGSF